MEVDSILILMIAAAGQPGKAGQQLQNCEAAAVWVAPSCWAICEFLGLFKQVYS